MNTVEHDTRSSAIFGKMLKRPREKGGEVRSQAIQTKYKIQQHQEIDLETYQIQTINSSVGNISGNGKRARKVNSFAS